MENRNAFLDAEKEESVLDKKVILDDSNDIFLITSILKPIESENNLQKIIKELENILENDLLKITENLKNQLIVYRKTKDLIEQIDEFSNTPTIFNKKIVGVGGSFSAGKSRFINSIIDCELLPTDTTPTTSFPTFITKGDLNKTYIYNSFSNKIEIDASNLRKLSHELSEKYDTSFTHVIKRIIIENKNMKLNNLVILDTPGYTKPEVTKKGYLTDEIIALEQLRISDYIIWLIDIEKGTISGTDIEFLKKINSKNKIFFVINKSDLKDKSAQLKVYESVIENLKNNKIEFEGVSVYSSKEKISYSGYNLDKYFEMLDKGNNDDLMKEIINKIGQINKILSEDILEKKNEIKKHLEIYNEVLLFKDELESLNNRIGNKIIENKKKLIKEWEKIEEIEREILRFQLEFRKKIEEVFEKFINKNMESHFQNNRTKTISSIAEKNLNDIKSIENSSYKKSSLKEDNSIINNNGKAQNIIKINNIKTEKNETELANKNNYVYLKENIDKIFNNIIQKRG